MERNMTLLLRLLFCSFPVIAIGCSDTGPDDVNSSLQSQKPRTDAEDSRNRTLADLKARLPQGSWIITSGSGAFTEHFAFTFRPDSTVAGRIYSDYDDTPAVRRWRLEQSDIPGWVRLAITVDDDLRTDNESAFYWLQSGSLIRYDSKTNQILISSDDSVADTALAMRNAVGQVYDDSWFPEPIR